MEQAQFTVFTRDKSGALGWLHSGAFSAPRDLDGLVRYAAKTVPPGWRVVAWAPRAVRLDETLEHAEAECFSSELEGHRVEFDVVTNRFIPRGVPVEDKKEERCCPSCRAPEGSMHEESCEILMAHRAAEGRGAIDPDGFYKAHAAILAEIERADAAMIARDGPAKPKQCEWVPIPYGKSTVLPANAALTRMSGGDHKLGASWIR